MNAERQLKHIRGIPYYVEGTNVYSFEVLGGKPSPHSVLLGTYTGDSVEFLPEWRAAVQHRVDAYRDQVHSLRRDSFRQSIDKPQKQSHSKRASRPAPRRAKEAVRE